MASTTASTSHIISNLHLGADADGVDLKVFGDTTGNYLIYDASVDSLLFVGSAAKLRVGTFSGATAGSGSALSSSNTAAFRVYADDGGAAIGSGTLARAGVFRNLLTYTGGNREQEAAGVIGQIVSVAGTNRHNMAGTWGSYEARTSLVVDGQAATTDTWIHAGVLARVGGASITINTNGVLAGVAAMSNIATALAANNGIYPAFYAGKWSGTETWTHGLYIQHIAVDKAIQVGELSSTAQTGIHLTSTNPNVADFFADDNNVTLGDAVYSNIRARTMLFKACTAGTIVSVKGQLKLYDEADLGPGVFAGVQGYLELATDADVKSGGKVWGVDSSIEAPTSGTLTVDSGGILAGFHAELTGLGTLTDNGITAGLYVDEQITTGTWGYGVYIAASAATTGIYVGTTSGTAINLPAGATYGKALAYGEFGTPIAFGDDEPFEIHGRLDANAKTKPLMRVRCSTPDGVAMTTGEAHAIQAQAYNTSTSDAAVLEAIQGHVGIKAAAEIIADIESQEPNMRAAWFKIEDLGFDLTLTGTACALNLGMQWNAGTTLTGNCDWIKLVKKGSLTDPADAMIRVYDGAGGGWATYLLDVPTSVPASVDAGTPGANSTHKIACRIGGTTAYIALYADY